MSHSTDSSDDERMATEPMDTTGPSTSRRSGAQYYNLRTSPKKRRVEVLTANFDFQRQRSPTWSPFQLGTVDDKFKEKVRQKRY